MELIADGVLILAATVAGLYCLVLSRRLHSLTQMESGLGKAITGMSEQVEEMKRALAEAKSSTEESAQALAEQVRIAEGVASKLEAMIKDAKIVEKTDLPINGAPMPARANGITAESVEEVQKAAPRKVKKAAARGSNRQQIDSLISSYLDEFEGEDEATIAHRLVSALTSTGAIKTGSAA